mmetsp:Transcript_22914/g.38212  ORF Transcript_22914/g.38212 Transcript_22914/m.38212 type:complete len:130 (-) Transcript_22914:214-603(-)
MSKRRSAKGKDENDEEGEEEEEEEEEEDRSRRPPQRKKQGYNYTAIIILLLFVVPSAFAVVLQVMDYMYPEAKVDRAVRERVVRCYESANPSKMAEIDKIMNKYKNRERALFAQLRNKYEKHPACQIHM